MVIGVVVIEERTDSCYPLDDHRGEAQQNRVVDRKGSTGADLLLEAEFLKQTA